MTTIPENSSYLDRECLSELARARVRYEELERRRWIVNVMAMGPRKFDALVAECGAARSAWQDLERRAEVARSVA